MMSIRAFINLLVAIARGVERLTEEEIREARQALIRVTVFLVITPLVIIPIVGFLPWMWVKNFILYILVLALGGSVFYFSRHFFNLVSIVGLVFNPAGGKGVSGRWEKTVEWTVRFILGILTWEAALALYAMVIPIHRAPSLIFIFLTGALVLAMGGYAWGKTKGAERAKNLVLGFAVVVMLASTIFFLFPGLVRSIQYQFFSPMGLETQESSWDYLKGLEKEDADWYENQLNQLARDRKMVGRTDEIRNDEIRNRERQLWEWKEAREQEYQALRPGVKLPEVKLRTNTTSFYFWFLLIIGVLLAFPLVRRRWGWVVFILVVFLLMTGLRATKSSSSGGGQTYSCALETPNPPHTVEPFDGGVKVTFDASVPSLIPTGFTVEPGQKIRFISSGRYRWDAKVPEPWVGPAGASWTPKRATDSYQFPLKGAPIASVIGYVSGAPFFIGECQEVTFARGGEIKLGLNERQGRTCYQDNRERISVSLGLVS